ncbi:MAG: LysM peptidoglycan-binding domain-containing protein [Rhizobiaceae bacterium]|nr:LysM peptidoglycan-binding domain-containing protein [Hyphomicrobiales bacterium]NRB31325.1 LysM peptidoglycan-binding domain-containing protein [Rhizobiaceae bacterium]
MPNFLALFGMKSMVAAGSVAAVTAGTAVVYRDEIPKLWEQVNVSLPLPKAHQEPVSLVREDDGTTPAVKKPVVTSNAEPKTEEVPVPKAEEVETVKIITPTFDLLRVEPDGSVLVAGNAAPNSKIDLVDSEGNVLATTQAGPEGDFVALPDGPLEPGDYVITLRAEKDGQEPVLSAQTSLVTVPERNDGEVLAMISEEGKPSEIITKPETLEAKEEPKPAEEPAAEVAKVEPVEEPKVEEVAKTEEEPKVEEVVEAEPETPAKPKVEVAAEVAAVEPKPAEEPAVEVAKVEEPKEPVKEPEVAAVEPVEEVKPEEPAEPAPQVIVEAVEVENGQVYVAGAVPRGVPVRIYIDNEFIGLTRGTSDERFLVSKEYNLTEGEHTVRADVISSKDGSVLSRAIVPLIHEVPEELQPEVEVAAAEPEAPAKVEEPVEVAAVETETDVKPEPVEEPKVAEAPAVEPAKPVEEVVETAPEPAPAATKVEVAEPKPEAAPVEEVAKVETPKVEAPKVEVAKVEPEAPKVEEPKVEVAKVEPAPKVEEPKVEVAAVAAAPAKPAAPRVLKTGRAVIIKRGDNLWRISRKTYGRGIRYTTIYNANRNQIANPHRIFIGQIFKIPEKAEQEG